METGISLQDITELQKFGNTILAFSNISLIAEKAFLEVKKKLSPQVVSIFLFSKDGFLERHKINGSDRNGAVIEASWLHDEKYKPGQSFSGRAVYGKPYGEPYWSNQLDKEVNDFIYGKKYSEKLGFLRCGISVPLNETYRTFGTIEVINRVNLETDKPDPSSIYSDSDVCWLTLVGVHVAAAISRLRKKCENEIYTTISKILEDHTSENLPAHSTERTVFELIAKQLEGDPKHYKTGILRMSPDYQRSLVADKLNSHSVYQVIAEQLVDCLTPYKICVMRLTLDGQNLFVINESSSDGMVWTGRVDSPSDANAKIEHRVLQSGKYEIVEDIATREFEFSNPEWIRSQNLKSFVCFPLLIQGKIVGTLSLFTGYVYEFGETDIELLENVSFLLAAYKTLSERTE
ncbi:MAG: GAF domain-containing protein [Synechococcales cyanobacterium K44_A2020_017]|nr:GAF domain-containing protein [Synechococcales cyanobacterium K32_A2020_035]MBF2094997.1 GAF domain-containing protein [Synechococcales cyanobacterium K44_A2020_017]